MNQREIEFLKNVTVQIFNDDCVVGNGTIFKFDDISYVVTAAHVLYGKDYSETSDSKRIKINDRLLDIKKCHTLPDFKQNDLDIAIAEIELDYNEPDYRCAATSILSSDSECFFRGSPLFAGEEKRNFSDLTLTDIPGETFILRDKNKTFSQNRREAANSFDGISGSGIFTSKKNKFYLCGVVVGFPDERQYMDLIECYSIESVKGINILKDLSIIYDTTESLYQHNLMVNLTTYQPLDDCINLLNQLLDKNSKYIFLQGGPGTGKSSLLSFWRHQQPHCMVQYYVFDFINPESYKNESNRGTQDSFLHDLNLQLKVSLRDNNSYLGDNIKDIFYSLLNKASQRYENTGIRTIVIVDGLDHIPREYKISDNLIKVLPHPDNIPNGITFVLGSQTFSLDGLSGGVKNAYEQCNTTIEIPPLKYQQVSDIIDSHEWQTPLNIQDKKSIYAKTEGHPLYLIYLVNLLQMTDPIDRDKTLNNAIKINGSIESYYCRLWEVVKAYSSLVKLLGLLCRIHGTINVEFLKELCINQIDFNLFDIHVKPLFHTQSNKMRFFHNSFKLFLLEYTSQSPIDNTHDNRINLDLHKDLISYYQKSEVESKWKRSFNIYVCGLFDDYCALVKPDDIDCQLGEFRSFKEIKQDAMWGLELAYLNKSIPEFIRYLLMIKDIERREINLDGNQIVDCLLDLGLATQAVNYICFEGKLVYKDAYAISICRKLLTLGLVNEAQEIFNLAWPEYITLQGLKLNREGHKGSHLDIQDLLLNWFEVAPYFVSFSKLIIIINNIEICETEHQSMMNKDKLRKNFIFLLCKTYAFKKDWQETEALLMEVDKIGNYGLLYNTLSKVSEICFQLDEIDRARKYLDRLVFITEHKVISPATEILLNIANLIYKIGHNLPKAISLIQDIPLPIVNSISSTHDGFKIFEPLILHSKLNHINGKNPEFIELDPYNPELSQFQNNLIEASLLFSKPLKSGDVWVDLEKIKSLFQYYYGKDSLFHSRNSNLLGHRTKYFILVLESISLYSSEIIQEIVTILFNEIHENPKYWPLGLIRSLIVYLAKFDYLIDFLKEKLISLEAGLLEGFDTDGRVAECLEQSSAWNKLGDNGNAQKWLKSALAETLGVGYRKDYQFSDWIDWLNEINYSSNDEFQSIITWFVSKLSFLKETTEGDVAEEASYKILDHVYKKEFSSGVLLSKCLLSNGLISFSLNNKLYILNYLQTLKDKAEFELIIRFYISIFLPTIRQGYPTVLERLIEKGYDLFGQQFFERILPTISKAICQVPIDENRYELISTIDEFSKRYEYESVNLLPKQKGQTKPLSKGTGSEYNILKMYDKEMTEDEVLQEVTNINKLLWLGKQEDKGKSFFYWIPILKKIYQSLTIDDLINISESSICERRASQILELLSRRALELGDSEYAQKFAESSLEFSNEHGWKLHYDGGSKISAFTALIKAKDVPATYEKAFTSFYKDIKESEYPGYLSDDLLKIIPLISYDYKVDKVWPEVYNFLQRLIKPSNEVNDFPVLSVNRIPLYDIHLDFLCSLQEIKASIIHENSLLLIAEHIHKSNNLPMDMLIDKLQLTDRFKVLEILLEKKSHSLIAHKRYFQTQLATGNFLHRNILLEILDYIFQQKILLSKSRFIQKWYRKRMLKFAKLPSHNSNNGKSKTPKEMSFVTVDILRSFSSKTSVEMRVLIERFNYLYEQSGFVLDYNAIEQNDRNLLSSIDLELPFYKTAFLNEHTILSMIALELVNDGLLTDDYCLKLLRITDYSIIWISPIQKPPFIKSLSLDDNISRTSSPGGWLNSIAFDKRLNKSCFNEKGNYIIAERYVLKFLNYHTPTEHYTSIPFFEEEAKHNKSGTVSNISYKDYYEVTHDPQCLLIKNVSCVLSPSYKFNWIAINPSVAKKLGWRPDNKNPFGWKDNSGQFMARSQFWIDGNLAFSPPLNSEVGEGWYIEVSSTGYSQIINQFRSLKLFKSIQRSETLKGNTSENEEIRIIDIRN